MMKLARLLVVALAAAALSSTTRAAAATVKSETAHYRLVSTGTQAEADDWSKMLEAAWPQYAEFFGKTPTLAKDERLAVAFFEDEASMDAAIKRAGGAVPSDAGGYYDPVSKAAYLFRQPSPWYTRTLMLHECAHQFHWRAKALKASPPFWFGEGIAEHVSRHSWDGEHLRLGVVPLLSLEKYASKALDAMKAPGFDVEKLFAGASNDRPLAMELVGYLVRGEDGKLRPKFDEIAAKVERGAKFDAAAAAGALGPLKKFGASWRAWVETAQEPWEVLTIDWDDRAADALRGAGPGVVGLCRRRADTRRVTARMRPLGTAAWKGGVLLRYGGKDDYDIGMIWSGTRAVVDRRKDGKWERLSDVAAPAAEDGAWRVEAVRDGGSVNFVVNGENVGKIESPRGATTDAAPGSMGLAVDASTVDFTEIVAE